MAIVFGSLWRMRVVGAVALVLFAGIAGMGIAEIHSNQSARWKQLLLHQGQGTRDRRSEVRTLTLDRLIHSYVDLDDPTFFVYGYEKIFADISTMVGYSKPQFSALYIGGGGYSMPRFLELAYPERPPGGHRN